MEKIMKNKKVLIILIIAVIIFVIGKIYCLAIINNMFSAIQKFWKKENRYYSVSQTIDESTIRKEEIFIKQPIVKYIKQNEVNGCVYEWKNLETNEQYLYNSNNEILENKELSIQDETFIKNLPNFISVLCENNKLNFDSVLRVNYIIPIKYNNKPCYKVVTKAETIIIDKSTYLPIYSAMKMHNSDGKISHEIEKMYEFEVGNITEDDVLLPDLTHYTNKKIQEKY